MLVLVQGFAITIMDFSSNVVTMIVTAMGTALTLFLGLRVERQRLTREVHREVADKKSDEIRRIQEAMISKALPASGFDLDELEVSLEYEPPIKSIPEPSLFIQPGWLIEPIRESPQRSAHFVIDGDKVYKPEDLLARNWKAVEKEEAEEIIFQPDFCKHCYRQIDGRVHAEGMAKGRMRCDPEDSQLVYGYNAEPTDADCGTTCMGHK